MRVYLLLQIKLFQQCLHRTWNFKNIKTPNIRENLQHWSSQRGIFQLKSLLNWTIRFTLALLFY